MRLKKFLLKIRRCVDAIMYLGLFVGMAGISNTGFSICYPPPATEENRLSNNSSIDNNEVTEIVQNEAEESFDNINPTELIEPTEDNMESTLPVGEETEPTANETESAGETDDDVIEDAHESETEPVETEPVDEAEPIIFKRHGVCFQEVNKTMYATCSINIRKGPALSYDVIGGLLEGQAVQVIGVGIGENVWNRIVHNGSTAYVCSEYLTDQPIVEN